MIQWAIRVPIEGAPAAMDERSAMGVTDVAVAGVEVVSKLAGSGAMRKARMSTLTDRVRGGISVLHSVVDQSLTKRRSPNEPRFGRLRGRSASPTPYDEGDGRFGFSEHDSHAGPRRYRSRSRSDNRRRREPSADRWTHDRANYDRQGGTTGGGRWQKDSALIESSPMGNHHRSNAIDASSKSKGGGESLLSRMTKNGQPLAPQQKPKRSLADRITRDDDSEQLFGRLKNDYSDPHVTEFTEPAQPRRGLADRITRDNDMNIRGRARSQEGINIRGSADRSGSGINIRGVASGA